MKASDRVHSDMLLETERMPGTRGARDAHSGTSQSTPEKDHRIIPAIVIFGGGMLATALVLLVAGFSHEWLPSSIMWVTEHLKAILRLN